MSLDDRHPLYIERMPDWEVLVDCWEGERRIKEKGDKYLPPTSGMIENGYPADGAGSADSAGYKAYQAYVTRALFHEFLREAIVGLVGVMHRKPPKVTAGDSDTLPEQIQEMIDSMTLQGESMELLWRRVTEQQLLLGGCGMLVDVPDGTSIDESVPYVAFYPRLSITNWDAGQRRQGRQKLELVVLDESEFQRQEDLSWKWVKQIRVCTLASEAREEATADGETRAIAEGAYTVLLATETDGKFTGDVKDAVPIVPRLGSTSLDEVPFVFCNVNDMVPEPDRSPMQGLARLQLAIYRGEADYRQSLFMQGQDTLVRTGATDEQQKVMTGVGAILDVPIGGDAKYIGVSSGGLTEQRTSLENDRAAAARYAVQMLDAKGSEAESGEALRVRVSARTATLISMQHAAAAAFQRVLQLAAKWLGMSDDVIDSIKVEPNLDFSDAKADPTQVLTLTQAVQAGLPLSKESLHAWLVENEYTVLEFEDEMEKIEEEKTDEMENGGAGGVIVDPNQDETELDENGQPVLDESGQPVMKKPAPFGGAPGKDDPEDEDAKEPAGGKPAGKPFGKKGGFGRRFGR